METSQKAALGFLLVLSILAVWAIQATSNYYSVESRAKVGEKLPAASFRDGAGNIIGLERYLGQRVLAVFVDFGCGSCQGLLDHLAAAGDGAAAPSLPIVLIAAGPPFMPLSLPSQGDGRIPVWSDPQRQLRKRLGIGRVPASLLLERDGTVLQVALGREALDAVERLAKKAGADEGTRDVVKSAGSGD